MRSIRTEVTVVYSIDGDVPISMLVVANGFAGNTEVFSQIDIFTLDNSPYPVPRRANLNDIDNAG